MSGNVEPRQRTVDGSTVPGARFEIRFVESDPKRGDEELARQALEYAVLAVNRIVRATAYLTARPRAVPFLAADQLGDFEVVEDLAQAGHRSLPQPRHSPVRPILLKGRIDGTVLQGLLDRAFSGASGAEELWREALDARCEQRPREALVAARAAVEVAWRDVATRRIEVLSASETPAVRAVLQAHLDEVLLTRTPMPSRLDRYSRSLLGFSVRDRWGDARCSEVGAFFGARNRGAHGSALLTHDEALLGVRSARDLIDLLERVRVPATEEGGEGQARAGACARERG